MRLPCLLSFKPLSNTRGFENWESFGYSSLYWGNIQSRDAFRQIARQRKYLMDYKEAYLSYSLSSPDLLKSIRFLSSLTQVREQQTLSLPHQQDDNEHQLFICDE